MAAEGGTLNVGIKVCEEPVEETKTAGITGLNTCPTDPRFQQQNKTSWCYTMFIDFHRCAYLLGADTEQCKYFEKCYKSLCPIAWIQDWEDKIEIGNFPRDLTKEMGR